MQRQLAKQVIRADQLPKPLSKLKTVAGADISNNWRDPSQIIYAALVVLDYSSLRVLEKSPAHMKAPLHYQPGFLAFREVPVLVEAYQALERKPDVILVDGHGISHPRGLGIASHLGVLLDCPTIGVAKSILIGKPEGELGPDPGEQVPLMWKGQHIAQVLRTRKRSNPLYISIGHKVSLETAVEIVQTCLIGYRLPEPTRQAHLAANAFRKAMI